MDRNPSISRDLLLRIPKCDDYPPERVTAFLSDLSTVDMAYALHTDIPDEAKIWCINHLRLFDKKTLHNLACDYAEHVSALVPDIPGSNMIHLALIAETRRYVNGANNVEVLEQLRDTLRQFESTGEGIKDDFRLISALEAAWSAADTDGKRAVINAGSCARDAVSPEKRDEEIKWQIERAKHYLPAKAASSY